MQEQVAIGLEDLDEMAQDLEQDKIAANELIPTLVPLASLVGSMAVLDENAEVLESFLKLKVFRNPVYRDKFEPLMSLAIRKDYKGMISVLNKYHVPPTRELLLESIARGDAKQVSALLNYGASKNIYFMLDSEDDLESKPGLQRINSILAEFDELCGDFGSPMDVLLQENPVISDFLYEDGIRSLHRPWSPIFVAAIAKDTETLEVLVDNGFKPFKQELYLIGKMANQMLKITDYRSSRKFSYWWNLPLQLAGLSAAIGGTFIVPKKYRISITTAIVVHIGVSLVGSLGTFFAEQFWASRSTLKKRNHLGEEERNLYDQLVNLDRDVRMSVQTVLN
ncbi:MAG: hypothetical protein AB8G05_00855 [Oligoflexales bacterium]